MFRSLVALTVCALAGTYASADDKYLRLVNVDSGKVLSVKDDSEEGGARAVLAKLDGDNKAQQWKLEKDGATYKLVNRKSGKVLDVNDDSKDEGGSIIIWDSKDEDFDNQRWSWVGEGKERKLKSKSSELVLDVDDEGQLVQKKAEEKSKKQLWRVEDVK
jgi:hypothetical protein